MSFTSADMAARNTSSMERSNPFNLEQDLLEGEGNILILYNFSFSRGWLAQRETVCFVNISSSDRGSRLAIRQSLFSSAIFLVSFSFRDVFCTNARLGGLK